MDKRKKTKIKLHRRENLQRMTGELEKHMYSSLARQYVVMLNENFGKHEIPEKAEKNKPNQRNTFSQTLLISFTSLM